MKSIITLGVVATLALAALPSYATGPYDGTWTLSSRPMVGSRDVSDPECAAMGIRIQIRDNQIVGNLQGAGTGAVVSGSGGSPVNGSVQSDGSVTAEWRGVKATGKITGEKLELSWVGACGPRQGTGERVSSN